MVRPLNTHSWKAMLAVAVVSAGLLWHMLACTESPMAFSPAGDLAFVTQEPYSMDNVELAGPTCYRLMLLPKDGKMQVLDQSVDWLMTAPAFSPDGKSVCYLRVRLLEPNDAVCVRELLDSRNLLLKQLAENAESAHWTGHTATTQPTTRPDAPFPAELGVPVHTDMTGGPMAPAELVVRDVKTGAIAKTVKFLVPGLAYSERHSEELGNMTKMYLLTKPQYADPNTVFLACDGVIYRASLAETTCAPFLALGSVLAVSPDGKTLAALSAEAVSIVNLERQTILIKGVETKLSLSGLSWTDNQTLALLQTPRDGNDGSVTMQLIKTDGSLVRQVEIPLKDSKHDNTETGELAIAPDGKHMCISYGSAVLFLDGTGAIISRLQAEKADHLVQPTFTPDSKQIAMKKVFDAKAVAEGGVTRATGIVFYSADGKAGATFPIEAIKPGTTRPAAIPERQPASAPATQP